MLNYERGQGDILLANTALEGLAKEIYVTYRTADLPGGISPLVTGPQKRTESMLLDHCCPCPLPPLT